MDTTQTTPAPVTTGAVATTTGTPEHETLLQKVGDALHKFFGWLGGKTVLLAEDVAPAVYNVLNALKNNFGIIAAVDQYIPGLPANVAAVINTKGPELLQKALAIVGGVEVLANPTADNVKAEAQTILETITNAPATAQQKFWTSFGTDLVVEIMQVVDQEQAGILTWGQAAIDLETVFQNEQADAAAAGA